MCRALWVGARPHNRFVVMHPIVEAAGVPGDFFIGMAEEVNVIELLPELVLHGITQREIAQVGQCFTLPLHDHVAHIIR